MSGARGDRVGASFLALGSGEILGRVVALGGTMYLARALGPAGMGVIGFVTALCSYLAFAVDAGFGDVGTREVARRPQDVSMLVAGGTLVRLAVAALAFLLVVIASRWIDEPEVTRLVLLLSGLSFFSRALDPSWAYKGLERNSRIGLALVLRQGIFVALVLVMVSGVQDLTRVPLCLFAAEFAISLSLLVPLVRRVRSDGQLFRRGLTILRTSAPIMASKLFRHLSTTFDVVMLGFILHGIEGERAVGHYTVPYRIVFMVLSLSVALHDSFRPTFVRAFAQGSAALRAMSTRAVALASAVAAPLVVGGVVVAGPLIAFLFGDEYLPGRDPFRLILCGAGLLFITGVFSNTFVATDRLKKDMVVRGAAAGLNVALNLVLIPRFGLMGAASATLVADACVLTTGFLWLRSEGLSPRLSPIARPLLAALVMGGVILWIGAERSLMLTLPIGAFSYAALLVLLRGVPEELRTIFTRREERP